MRPIRNSDTRGKFPPNPNQWEAERHGLALRERFSRPLHVPLDPFEIARNSPGIELMDRTKLETIVGPITAAKLFGKFRRTWSGFTIPLDDLHLIVVNDTHVITRQNVTLTEELFHTILKHKPCRLFTCPKTGMIRREYSKETENQAYYCAAAAMLDVRGLLG